MIKINNTKWSCTACNKDVNWRNNEKNTEVKMGAGSTFIVVNLCDECKINLIHKLKD